MADSDDTLAYAREVITFKPRYTRVLATHGTLLALASAFAIFMWLKFHRYSGQLLVYFIGVPWFAYWQYRNTYVAVELERITIKSPWSVEGGPKVFAWSEVTKAVVLTSRPSTVEVRSGSRFGWINYGMLADPAGLIEAVRRFGGEGSHVHRALLELRDRNRAP